MALIAILVGGCSGADLPPPDTTPSDAGLDVVVPPDVELLDGGKSGNIGASCDVLSGLGCTGQAVCLAVGAELGICVIEGCTLEALDTPAMEDDCPETTACTTVPVEGPTGEPVDKRFCLLKCTPDPSINSCAAINPKVACDPLSVLGNGHTEVCLLPACTKDRDCGNHDELNPDSRCEEASGVCFNIGTPEAEVGDPCQISKDCGPSQLCLKERYDDGQVRFPGGYCTVLGCKFEGPWTCPGKSKCFGIGSENQLTLCLSTGCEPGQPCREGYECLDVDSVGVCWLDLTP